MARGNVVLAEHGARRGTTSRSSPRRCRIAVPYRPALRRPGLAHVQPYTDADARRPPAAQALAVDPRTAVADLVRLFDGRDDWTVRPDLLGSDRFAPRRRCRS